MKNLILRVILFFFVGCNQTTQNLDLPSEKVRLARKVRKQVAMKLKKELDLYPCGSGGQAMYKIKMLSLSFDYYKPVDVKKGRELLVAAVLEFMKTVNANEKIRPFLHNYPFTVENVEIIIFIKNLDGSPISFGKLKIISTSDGFLKYRIDNPTGLFTTIYEETFERAVEKLQMEKKEGIVSRKLCKKPQ